jgi:hypothetical protein
MCNHERFLRSTELECRRIARSCNDGTQGRQEWLKTAECLLERRSEHVVECEKCSNDK